MSTNEVELKLDRAKKTEEFKVKRLQVRLTAQEVEAVKRMANKQGVSVSDLVRKVLFEERKCL